MSRRRARRVAYRTDAEDITAWVALGCFLAVLAVWATLLIGSM
jgi:hypothetical protein